ncbi:MAG: prepilin-type N-terminal cleavage/methylation domain-containing protein [Gemmatimonadota bacterium]|nr:prepilin-type N-terminal cleavage/methylation domain-containing protein [Gemmatimonadota bacterium]
MRRRPGQTLVELLIALVLLAILGGAVTRLMVWQSRFFDQQAQGRAARSAARSGMNLLLSELRMLDASGLSSSDTVSVSDVQTDRITVRVPFAFGIVCSNTGAGGSIRIAVLPVDSLLWATTAIDAGNGGFSGYAWRDNGASAAYHFVDGLVPANITDNSAAALGDCGVATIGIAANGRFVDIQPGATTGGGLRTPRVGTPIYLYQMVRYSFSASAVIPGTLALWRTVMRTGTAEEVAAPFAATAQFKWFVKTNSGAPTTAVPDTLANIRGFELMLPGMSERVAEGASTQATAAVSTSVYFKNRID